MWHRGGLDAALAALADAGFDLAHTFDAHAQAREPGLRYLSGSEQLGILIGNTRALWPHFIEAMRDPQLASDPHPLDRYTERTLAAIFGEARIYYGHRRYDGAFLPLQQLATATGMGALAPSRLVIHPIYGPWFALRAIVVIDGIPPGRAPIAKPCQCESPCSAALQTALASPESWPVWLAVRDACKLRAWRYSEEQIHYHYTKVWVEEP